VWNFYAIDVPPRLVLAAVGSMVSVLPSTDVFRGTVSKEFAGTSDVPGFCAFAGLGFFEASDLAGRSGHSIDYQLFWTSDDVWAGSGVSFFVAGF